MKVAVVEDNNDLRPLFEIMLQKLGHEVITFPNVDSAIHYEGWDDVSVALVDWSMPEENGGIVAAWLEGAYPDIARVLITALPEGGGYSDLLFSDVLHKPFTEHALQRTLDGQR